jgi:hypothetical protein
MAMANQPTPPPRASAEGVGRGQECGAKVSFNSADLPIKTLITKLNDYFSFYNPPNSIAVHTMY